MAMIYSLGTASEGIDQLAQKLELIPKAVWQPYPAPPSSYKLLESGHSPELIQSWSDAGIYCPTCFAVSKNLRIFTSSRLTNPATDNYFIRWQVKLAKLANSASNGCHFCGLMACEFFVGSGHVQIFTTSSQKNPLACCGYHLGDCLKHSDELNKAIERLEKFCERHEDPQFTFIAQPQDWDESIRRYGKVKFLASSTNLGEAAIKDILCCRRDISIEVYGPEASQCFKYKPVNTEPDSDDSILKMKLWLQECIETHHDCAKPESSHIPKRVIEIMDEDQLALCCNVQEGFYAALSYCWGGPQTFSTIASNFADMQKGFSASNLPQTLRDAVELARKLGCRYIWIDSLCIIQDSPTDKEAEIPKMPSYYKNAYLTICAGGVSCHQGFLAPRDRCSQHAENPWPKDLLQMPFLCINGETRLMLFRKESPYCLSWEPISRRAWTFQERLLSTRMIIFGSRTIWQCNQRFISDGGVEDWNADPRTARDRRLRRNINTASAQILEQSPCGKTSQTQQNVSSVRSAYNIWYQAIEEYSRREMSLPEDKLPAISGLAIELARIIQDEYIAGLWLRDVLKSLMWSTWPFLQIKKPAVWRAPSWSWASVDSAVNYNYLNYMPADANEVAEVVECTATSVSPQSLYGRIANATLRLRAPLLEFNKEGVLAQALRRQYTLPPLNHSLTWDAELNDILMAADRNGGCESEWKAPEKMSFLVLFTNKTPNCAAPEPETLAQGSNSTSNESAEQRYHGLFVTKVDEDQYERVASYVGLQMPGLGNIKAFAREVSLV